MTKTTSKPKESKFETKLTWLPKKTFELEITVPKEDVKKAYEEELAHVTTHTTVKGFRQGKAPIKMVEEQVGKEKIYFEAANHLVSKAYFEAVKANNLSPIVDPAIDLKSAKEGEDWVLVATSCEMPEVKLGDYKDVVKTLKAKDAIWTPEKGKDEKKPTLTVDTMLEEILKVSTVEISDVLIQEETNRLLSSYLEQINASGLNMQQYLKARGITTEQHKQQVTDIATQTLKIDFILNQISNEEKLTVSDKDLEALVAQAETEENKKALRDPARQNYIRVMLLKQKTIDFLKNL